MPLPTPTLLPIALIEHSTRYSASLCWGRAMSKVYVLRAELVDALKDCLHDLEELKLISPGDLDVIDERRILRQKIDQLEEEE